jgi:hypothetical protein
MTMGKHIRQIRISPRSLSPVEADLLLDVELEASEPDVEFRGRLVGPTCAYANTIEISYPVRVLPRESAESPLRGRVVIPEPSWWDPISPFLYRGQIELWRAGAMLDRATVRFGLRSVQLKPDGLFWNGKRLILEALDRSDLLESELPMLRRQGINAVILPVDRHELWLGAERLGFVILGRIDEPAWPDVSHQSSPALLGWILPAGWDRRKDDWSKWMAAVSDGNLFVRTSESVAGLPIFGDKRPQPELQLLRRDAAP